jgi:maltose alpha-D-glucosyltransferase/alpha-amylase
MLNWTERIIRMRKEVPEIGWGDFTELNVRNPAILALRYDRRNNSVLFLHSVHEQPSSSYGATKRLKKTHDHSDC